MEDILETMLGLEIVDESDKDVDMQKLARKRLKERFINMEDDGSVQDQNKD